MTLVRHLQYKLCPVNHFGRNLHQLFTLVGRRLPDPSTDDGWEAFEVFAVFGLDSSGVAVSYATMNCHIKKMLVGHDILISKVCHAFRSGGAQWADLYG